MTLEILFRTALYLVPPALLALAIARLSRFMLLFAFLTWTGTVVHELLHWLVGALTNAQPASLSLLPSRTAGGYTLGTVGFRNLRWYNAAPAALAPLLALPLVIGLAYWRIRAGWSFRPLDAVLWCALAPQLLSCWPSGTDWRLAARSWPVPLLLILLVAAYWYGQGTDIRYGS